VVFIVSLMQTHWYFVRR